MISNEIMIVKRQRRRTATQHKTTSTTAIGKHKWRNNIKAEEEEKKAENKNR